MRIAYVIPWFGPELKGGAEQHAWQFATRLAARGHDVEALTTCCRSYPDDWAVNQLPAGEDRLGGVTVRRFPLDPRNRHAFDELNGQLLSLSRAQLRPGVSPVPAARARIWTDENINSRALEGYLAAHGAAYDALIFIPYLYGPTLRGVHLTAANAWMQPCLHDEAYAYLPDTAAAIHAVQGLLFNSEGEQHLAARLYGPAMWSKGHVAGGGIEFSVLDEHRGAGLPTVLQGRKFVLCLGRREPEKGVDFLIEAHRLARRRDGDRALTLVLAGPGQRSYHAPEQGVLDMGLVSEELRVALLYGCAALAIPSPNESFSRALYEAWYAGKPALVRRACDATRLPVEQCSGGWVADDVQEWALRLSELAQRVEEPDSLSEMGRRGSEYTKAVADWDRVMERFESIVGMPADRPALKRPVARAANRDGHGYPEAIHQLSPNLGFGDAISNEMLEIRAMLRAAGYRSDIIATFVDSGRLQEGMRFEPGILRPEDGLIYHHSIGAEVTAAAIEHPGPKGLIYHNITPPEYFRPYRPDFARLLRDGREDLWRLAQSFPVSVGDSEYNAAELRRYGFRSPGVMPLPVDPIAWDLPPSPEWMERLGDGRTNILFVGRVAPNKRQDRLVQAFSLLREVTDARLVIAGSAPQGDPYADHVRSCVRQLGLDRDVIVTGHCSLADLHAFFRCADLFWSFSEHEGFCVPLIEAMWFDIPVAALSSSAVPETLGDAGLQFPWMEEDAVIAGKVLRVLKEEPVRRALLASQLRRRESFRRAAAMPHLARFVERIVAAEEVPAA